MASGAGSDANWELTPEIWWKSRHIERWLRGIWPSWRYDDIRDEWDESGHWYWIIPDFQRGRSRIVGIEVEVLKTHTVDDIRKALETTDWLARIDKEDLLVVRDESGELRVEVWNPEIEETWFPDPRGGYFAAYVRESCAVSFAPGYPPPREYLTLHGATWSAMGPENPRPPKSYSVDELQQYLPRF